ncbi:MAG: glycosyltransferase 87 family protein [Acidimicrobiales bacterium]
MASVLRRFADRALAAPAVGKDAFLYGGSMVFALVTAIVAVSADYRDWGEMAAVAYGLAFLVCFAALGASRRDRLSAARVGQIRRLVVLGVLAGAVVAPLASELVWRSEAVPGQHAQAEVAVVERAGDRLAGGANPYLSHPSTVGISPSSDAKGIDADSYYPYLPGMVPFGLLNATSLPKELGDARVSLSLFTLVIAAIALATKDASVGRKGRVLQFLVILPSGALPIVTGGDDMPVIALMLLGLVLAATRHPVLCGLALGCAATLKFTAWPVLLLVMLVARDKHGRPAGLRYAISAALVVVPIVAVGALPNPSAFFVNVVKFPLGIAKVHSPAASPLIGEVLVSIFPHDRRAITFALVAVGLVLIAYGLKRFTPRTPAQVARFTAWALLLAIVLLPATRFGYLIYPANLFVFSYLIDGIEASVVKAQGYSASLTSNSLSSTELVGATLAPPSAGLREVVARFTTTPSSQ